MTLIQQLHELIQARQRVAVRKYRELLARAHAPHESDAEELLGILDLLGWCIVNVRVDLERAAADPAGWSPCGGLEPT